MNQEPEYIEPADFPVQWTTPEEREFTWVWDDVHTPIPNTPLTISVIELRNSSPRTDLSSESTSPRPLRRIINGYSYSVRNPTQQPSAEDPARSDILATLRDARRRWDNELVPTLIREIQIMHDTPLHAITLPALTDQLDIFLNYYRNHWLIHMQAVGPVFRSTEFLVPLYEQITSSTDPSEPYMLLQGFDNLSLKVDRELRQLAGQAKKDPRVTALFLTDPTTKSLSEQMRKFDAGRSFLSSLQTFLDSYGHRSPSLDFCEPTWVENPGFVLLAVRGLLRRDFDSDEDPLPRLARERESLVRKTIKQIGSTSLKKEFLEILRICQDLWPIREDHAFYIEQASGSQTRRILKECGHRLSLEAVIEHPDEVFYLTLAEVKDALTAPGKSRLTTTAHSRRLERQRFIRINPPQFLGKAPSPELLADKSETAKFIRFSPVLLDDEQPSVLRGAGGSPGVVSGIARVIETPEELWKIEPGDILVCRSTSPPWTPIFQVIGGLVTNAGGVLSHGAIIAREYKLPAVMGTKHATRVIRDGQLLSLDGQAGLVILR